jgi:Zn-dependent peptidase ImmA (M78 family)
LPDFLWGELAEAAAEMRNEQSSPPVLLNKICARLGIRIARRKSVQPGKAYLEWNRARGETPVVLLPTKEISRWDRFCAAHELGHFVLISRHEWQPQDSSSYWETEALCDFFARELLLPACLFEDKVVVDARSAMEECNSIASKAKIPWIQAAKKMTEQHPHLIYLRLNKTNDPRLRVIGTSMPGERGIGIKVNARAPFTRFARQALGSAQAEGQPVGRTLDRNDFLGSTLGEFFSEFRVREIFMEASAKADQIKLTAVRQS